jgi:hypothetical protein
VPSWNKKLSILESMMAQVVAIVTKNIPEAITNFEMSQETPKV